MLFSPYIIMCVDNTGMKLPVPPMNQIREKGDVCAHTATENIFGFDRHLIIQQQWILKRGKLLLERSYKFT